MKEEEIIKIGSKDVKCYLKSALFSLDKNKEAILQALGGRQAKLIDVSEKLEEIDGIEIIKRESIEINGTPGLKIIARKEEGRDE